MGASNKLYWTPRIWDGPRLKEKFAFFWFPHTATCSFPARKFESVSDLPEAKIVINTLYVSPKCRIVTDQNHKKWNIYHHFVLKLNNSEGILKRIIPYVSSTSSAQFKPDLRIGIEGAGPGVSCRKSVRGTVFPFDFLLFFPKIKITLNQS